ncbi:MAG: FMN-binding protein, partial [Sedimentisphaerales bacterium]
YSVLASSETPGFGDQINGDYFRKQFAGAPAAKLDLLKSGNAGKIDNEIVAISGATVSSTAVVNIFNNYIEQVKEQLKQKGLLK